MLYHTLPCEHSINPIGYLRFAGLYPYFNIQGDGRLNTLHITHMYIVFIIVLDDYEVLDKKVEDFLKTSSDSESTSSFTSYKIKGFAHEEPVEIDANLSDISTVTAVSSGIFQ